MWRWWWCCFTFFFLLLALCRGIGTISPTYYQYEIRSTRSNAAEVTLFTVDFNNTIFTIEGVLLTEMKIDDERLGGIAYLECTFENGTSFIEIADPVGAPFAPLPLIPSEDPVFTTISGDKKAEGLLVNRFSVVKTTKICDREHTFSLFPSAVDITQCSIGFYNATLVESTGFIPNTLVRNFVKDQPICEDLLFKDAVDYFYNSTRPIDFDPFSWEDSINVAEKNMTSSFHRKSWFSCFDILDVLFYWEEINKTIREDVQCRQPLGTDQWKLDPCCNENLKYNECCSATNRNVTINQISGINETAVISMCDDPVEIFHLLNSYKSNLGYLEKCTYQSRNNGFYPEARDYLKYFVKYCVNGILGDGYNRHTCVTDDDCYTSCNKETMFCEIPFDNPEIYIGECFLENMNKELLIYFKERLGIRQNCTKEEFSLALKNLITKNGCIGPTAFSYYDTWEVSSVESCNETYCHCAYNLNGVECHAKRIESFTSESNCTSDMGCNWKIDEIYDLYCNVSDFDHFCGLCNGNLCKEVSKKPMCYKIVETIDECSFIGGIWKYNSVCLLDWIVSIEQCNDPQICARDLAVSNWCYPVCYNRTIANKSECESIDNNNLTYWMDNMIEGAGVCTLLFANKQECLENGWNWNYGSYFIDGVLDTEDKCANGICSIDNIENITECEIKHHCTIKCEKCVPYNGVAVLCYNTFNETQCRDNFGVYYQEQNICDYYWLRDRNSCEAIGNTFESCRDLDLDTCYTCQQNNTQCPIIQQLLYCEVSSKEECMNKEECEARGACNDVELINKHNSSYNGVCTFDFDSEFGYPMCYGSRVTTKFGCADYVIDSRESCEFIGGIWRVRASNRSECEEKMICEENNLIGLTNKNETVCDRCGGVHVQAYQWVTGEWIPGQIKQTQWKKREIVPLNKWTEVLDLEKLDWELDETIKRWMKNRMPSEILCKYSLIAQNLVRIACSCSQHKGLDCFGYTLYSKIAETDLLYGIETTHEWGLIKVKTNKDTLTEDVPIVSIEVGVISDLFTFIDSTTSYEIVVNDLQQTVGQLVGLGVMVQFGLSTGVQDTIGGNITLCIYKDDSIEIDGDKFPRSDFGFYDFDSFSIKPLGFVVLTEENGSLYCIDISNSGIYFPIQRIENWDTDTGEQNDTNNAPNNDTYPMPVDTDNCGYLYCSENGLFNNVTGNCECFLGFTGERCSDHLLCYNTDCGQHGRCDNNTGLCICDEGYESIDCDVPYCGSNGIYTPSIERCKCKEGFSGVRCTECGISPIGREDLKYICYKMPDPSITEYILVSLKENLVNRYIIAGSILPGTDPYDCDCKIRDSINNIAVSNANYINYMLERHSGMFEEIQTETEILGILVTETEKRTHSSTNTQALTGVLVTAGLFVIGAVIVTVFYFDKKTKFPSGPKKRV